MNIFLGLLNPLNDAVKVVEPAMSCGIFLPPDSFLGVYQCRPIFNFGDAEA